jgi:hypothetical protein
MSFVTIGLVRFICVRANVLDRHGLRPRDDVIASDLAFSREHSVAGGNPCC